MGKPSTTAAFPSGKTPLVVIAADSLIIPFGDLVRAFESKYPGIDVQAEYHGSIQVIRQVTDLHRSADVIATADASLVPMLMYVAKDPATGRPDATWYIRFASNHLALAYRPSSKYAREINSGNWYGILDRPDVRVGMADPRFDATGYRTLMALVLAQDYYGKPTIFNDLLGGQFTYPLGVFQEGGLTTVTVPEIVETKADSHVVIRGTSLEVMELLEAGDLDYGFDYESVILQHGLKMVQLPDAVNLGEAAYSQTYSTVQVDLDYQRFASVNPQFRGERIGYGITIPSTAPHPNQAQLFIAFLLGPEGRGILEADHHPIFDPSIGDQYENIPKALQTLCVPGEAP
ncbi:MAG: tungstate ABC transporter substrate-binding protein WtpA [Anaerolineales bacterium]|jgi:molybdate/tungstate transport system substrate-binding protein